MVTIQNHRTVMRDSAGRIFQQRSSFVPKDGTQQSHVLRFEISDPKAHTRYICYSSRRTCEIEEYFATTNVSMVPAGPLDSKGDRYLTRESLGPNNMSGVDVTGTRETVTINTGVIGNDKPVSVVKEFWYSPKLGINVSVKRMDPRHGTQTFTISDISLSEPDPKYFSVSAGYTLVDHRRRSLQTAATHGN